MIVKEWKFGKKFKLRFAANCRSWVTNVIGFDITPEEVEVKFGALCMWLSFIFNREKED